MKVSPGARRDRWITSISRYSEKKFDLNLSDSLAVEEPLEIRLRVGETEETVAVTMRTPGDDAALAVGFLYSEGVIDRGLKLNCRTGDQKENCVVVEVAPETLSTDQIARFAEIRRDFFINSSCGICGKASLEALAAVGAKPITSEVKVAADVIVSLPSQTRHSQDLFAATGGLHAAASFDSAGKLLDLYEDVGRHNALDKLVGSCYLGNKLPLSASVLLLSGRASFELIQKAVRAEIPVVCAVGAPSSLAVAAAREFGVTLCGFVRDGRFNIYSHPARINE